jgi:glycine reductase
LERAGIPTALLCNLVSIAVRVGAPRIVPTRGIPFPTGDPELAPDEERHLRRRLLDRALEALQTPVAGPTVFDAPDQVSGPGMGATKAPAP